MSLFSSISNVFKGLTTPMPVTPATPSTISSYKAPNFNNPAEAANVSYQAPSFSNTLIGPVKPVVPKVATTTSGNTINRATGGVTAPATPVINSNQNNAGTAPVVPNINMSSAPVIPATDNASSTNNVQANPFNSPLYTSPAYEEALKNYMALSTPSTEETDTQKAINNLTASLNTAFTNTEGQAIPLEFITGQKQRLQEEATNLANPLLSNLQLLQNNRIAQQTAAQALASSESNKIAAYRDYNKPVSTSFGTSLVNPATGQTVFGGTGTGSDMDIIGKAITDGRLTNDMITRYGAAAIVSALKQDPNYNFVTQKSSISADSDSLKKQQTYYDNTQAAFNTANSNLTSLISWMNTNGVNNSSIPLINTIENKVKAGALDPGTAATLKSSIQTLRTEYARVLSRGGEVTDTVRREAEDLIPDNLTPVQLAQLADRLKTEGNAAINETQSQITTIKDRMGKSGSSSTGGGSSGTLPSGAKWTVDANGNYVKA